MRVCLFSLLRHKENDSMRIFLFQLKFLHQNYIVHLKVELFLKTLAHFHVCYGATLSCHMIYLESRFWPPDG